MPRNEKYSFKDFTGQDLTGLPASEFNDSEIVGSCFYREAPYDADSLGANAKEPSVDVFPLDVVGLVLTRCNLDNVTIPAGATVGDRNSNRRLRVQNDNQDWICDDSTYKPIELCNMKQAQRDGLNTDPANIPETRVTTNGD
jgi:hypothetical protein